MMQKQRSSTGDITGKSLFVLPGEWGVFFSRRIKKPHHDHEVTFFQVVKYLFILVERTLKSLP